MYSQNTVNTKISKLRTLRPLEHARSEEESDSNYVQIFKKIKTNRQRISIHNNTFLNEEDDRNLDINDYFEGFNDNEDKKLREYCENFKLMLQNLNDGNESLGLNINEENVDIIDEFSADDTMVDILDLIPKPLEDEDEKKAKENPNEVDYFILEKGSKNVNNMISDSWG